MSTELEQAREQLQVAETALSEAREAFEKAEQAEMDAAIAEVRGRQADRFARVMAMSDEAFVALQPIFDVRPYILPFGSDFRRFNPKDPQDWQDHDFGQDWLANMTAIICKKDERTRPTRLIWTSGFAGLDAHDRIGQRFEARHDQTNAKLGTYEIVGLAFFGPDGRLARIVGDVPSIKFAQSTYK